MEKDVSCFVEAPNPLLHGLDCIPEFPKKLSACVWNTGTPVGTHGKSFLLRSKWKTFNLTTGTS